MQDDLNNLTYPERNEPSRYISDVICALGIFFLIVFGIKSLMGGAVLYANVLFGFALSTFISFAYYKKKGNWAFHRGIVISGLTSLYLFLLASGGESDTGLLWCYSYPLIIFFLVGPKQGKRLMLAIFVCSLIILYLPDFILTNHNYSTNLKHRFTGSMLFVSIMAYCMERSRLLAQQTSDIAHANLTQLARSDELTGAFNRRGIKAKVQEELHRVVRDKTEMSIVLCDVDLFKTINDRHGHDIGDLALQHIANLLSDTVRVTDMVGRWGGEEFLIMLPNTNLHKGYQLIERVREKIASEPVLIEGLELNVSISCGICSTRFFSQFSDLIKAADISLYEAKAQGRNCTRPKLAQIGNEF